MILLLLNCPALTAQEKSDFDPNIFLNIARYHVAVDEYPKAINNYEHFLSFHKDNEPANLEYARVLFWMGKINKSLDVLDHLIKVKGRKPELLLEKATVLSFGKKFEDAIAIYNEILAKEPDNMSAHLGLSYIYLKSPAKSNSGKEYRTRINELQERFKFSVQRDIAQTNKIADELKYKAKSRSGLSKQQILLELAFLKRNVEKYDESVHYFRRYLENDDDNKVRLELARTLNWAKRLPEAISELNIILKKDPQNIEALHELAMYESWLGNTDDADSHYAKLIEIVPENIDYRLERADNLKWAAYKSRSNSVYKDILAKDPSNKKAWQGFLETASLSQLIELNKKQNENRDIVIAIHNYYMKDKRYEEDVIMLERYLRKHPRDVRLLQALSTAYISSSKFEEAKDINKRILKINPKNKYARTTLPKLYYWTEGYEEAASLYADLERSRELSTDEKYEYAEVLFNIGKKEEAKLYYRQVFKENPQHEEIFDKLIEVNDYETLEEQFNKNPVDRELARLVSNNYIINEQLEGAARVLKKHLEYDPKDYKSTLLLARVLSWDGKYDESIIYYDTLLHSDYPIDSLAITLESANVASWSGDLSAAFNRYKLVLREDPENVDALVGISKIYMWQGNSKMERQTYEKIIEVSPVNMYAIRMLERSKNNPSVKIPKLEAYLKEHPKDTKTIKELITLYEQIEDYDKAYVLAKQLSQTDPDNKELLARLETARQKSSEMAEARIIELRRKIYKRPFSKAPRKELINFFLSRNRNEEAIEQLQQYLILFPEDREMREKYAAVLSWEGRYSQAGQEYETLMLKDPGNIEYKVALARIWSWERPEKYPAALKLTNEVIAASPKNSEAHLIRGNLYYYSDNHDKALRDYRKTLSLDKDNMEAKDGIDTILNYKSEYSARLGFWYKEDNVDFKDITAYLELLAKWNRTLDSKLRYSHSTYMKSPNPDLNAERIKFTQGLRLSDYFYTSAFMGYNKYIDHGGTYDYGASLQYRFTWHDHVTLGFENTDILTDVFTYESLSPKLIDSNYVTLNALYHVTNNSYFNFDSKIGFYSDDNRSFMTSLVYSWTFNLDPVIAFIGSFRFFRVNEKLYAVPRYWDPPWYFSLVPGLYIEVELTDSILWFADGWIGWGIEDGNSELEIGIDSGFGFKITRGIEARLQAFYSQTGRDLNSQNYYLYGARGYISFGF